MTPRAADLYFEPHLVRTFKLSNDPNFAEKVVDIVGLYMNRRSASARGCPRSRDGDGSAPARRLGPPPRPLGGGAHYVHELALPALGGLLPSDAIPDLDKARLPNRAVTEAIFRLAWLREACGLVPVNWRDMETEELGLVYESLLDLTPQFIDGGRDFAFVEAGEARDHARKTTGSYYTPDKPGAGATLVSSTAIGLRSMP
jgi:hypothetical protein